MLYAKEEYMSTYIMLYDISIGILYTFPYGLVFYVLGYMLYNTSNANKSICNNIDKSAINKWMPSLYT